jgi:hypothetical protein
MLTSGDPKRSKQVMKMKQRIRTGRKRKQHKQKKTVSGSSFTILFFATDENMLNLAGEYSWSQLSFPWNDTFKASPHSHHNTSRWSDLSSKSPFNG